MFAGLPSRSNTSAGTACCSGMLRSSVYSPSSNTSRATHGTGGAGAAGAPVGIVGAGIRPLGSSSRSQGRVRRDSTMCGRLSWNAPWPLLGGKVVATIACGTVNRGPTTVK